MVNVKMLMYWINERAAILARREAGQPKPWTKDTILASYRFCNVRREDDTVTKWIAEHWMPPGNPDAWFAAAVARLVNWPATLEALGVMLPWNPVQFKKRMAARAAAGEKVFSGAYIVSTNGRAMDKPVYLADHVLTPLWKAREMVRPRWGDTLAEFHARLMQFDGMGSFMAAQVIADTKHVFADPLDDAPDWHSWAASGPGSRRGMNRLYGLDTDAPWRESVWLNCMQTELQPAINKMRNKSIPCLKEPLDAQNIQNCLCEFDKYMRTLNGEGRPRSTYPGRS